MHALQHPPDGERIETLIVQDSQLSAKWDAFLNAHYKRQIQSAALDYPDVRSVEVDFKDIDLRDPELADYVLQRPAHALRVGTTTLYQVDVTVEPKPRLTLRIKGLPDSQRITPGGLRAEHMDRFMRVEGLVKRISEVRKLMVEAAFECKVCGNLVHIIQEETFIQEPVHCDNCDKQTQWRRKTQMSRLVDYQVIDLQDRPEGLRGGLQPGRVLVHARDDLVNDISPGDRVRVNGIPILEERRNGNRIYVDFKTGLDAVSFDHEERVFEEVQISSEDQERIEEIAANNPRLLLRKIYAPDLFGLDDQKDALLLALFGGTRSQRPDGGNYRPDIHVLLVGDPGVAKSELILWLKHVAPRCVKTSGKASSAAGLTGAAVKDSFNEGQWAIEAGALVMADMGIAIIDELDKMSVSDQGSMHPAMEQQEIDIAKAGAFASMKTRCPVIAAANPKLGRFDEYEPIHAQINMPPALLSRFDFIFSLLDKPNKEHDAAIASHMLRRRQQAAARTQRLIVPEVAYDAPETTSTPGDYLDTALFRKYVAFARRHIHPVLSDEAVEMIEGHYAALRCSGDGSVPITARSLDALARISEAAARMRLSQVVEKQDVEHAVRIHMASLRSTGVDPETGKFDVDVIAAGVSKSQHNRVRAVQEMVRDLAKASSKGYARLDQVLDAAAKQGMSENHARKALDELKRNSSVYAKGGTDTFAPMNP